MPLRSRKSLFSVSPDFWPLQDPASAVVGLGLVTGNSSNSSNSCDLLFVGDSLAHYEYMQVCCHLASHSNRSAFTPRVDFIPGYATVLPEAWISAFEARAKEVTCGIIYANIGAHFFSTGDDDVSTYRAALRDLMSPLDTLAGESGGRIAVVFATAPWQHFDNGEDKSTAFEVARAEAGGPYLLDQGYTCSPFRGRTLPPWRP